MNKTNVMISGLPGNMATKAAEHIINSDDFEILNQALTGPEITDEECIIKGEKIQLFIPNKRDSSIDVLLTLSGPFLTVDYTHPNAVNDNADFYCKKGLHFVMGTTGGDRKALEQRVKDSDVVAVIAPNMAKQIVAFQAMMQYASETLPDTFKGYTLEIVESHQKGKADTSGTALAMVEKPDGTKGYFNLLGVPFKKEQIKMIREPTEQLAMGVPKEYLSGHGWHTYTLKSEDGSVLFRFTHNVNGRDIYGLGTLDSLRFLKTKVEAGEKGKVYSMINVLKGK